MNILRKLRMLAGLAFTAFRNPRLFLSLFNRERLKNLFITLASDTETAEQVFRFYESEHFQSGRKKLNIPPVALANVPPEARRLQGRESNPRRQGHESRWGAGPPCD